MVEPTQPGYRIAYRKDNDPSILSKATRLSPLKLNCTFSEEFHYLEVKMENKNKRALFEKLLNHINLSKQTQDSAYMKRGILKEVNVFPSKGSWHLVFEFPAILPISLYKEFRKKLQLAFVDVAEISLSISVCVNEFSKELLNDYLPLVLADENFSSEILIRKLTKAHFLVDDEKRVTLEVDNHAVAIFFEQKYLKILADCFQNFGFPQLKINLVVDEELAGQNHREYTKKTQASVEKIVEKAEEKERNNSIKSDMSKNIVPTLGRTIAGSELVIPMSEISEEETRVTFEGIIFAKEIRETKTGRKILNIKVTDYTSSFQMQKFANSEHDEKVFEALQEKSWIRVRGAVQYNNFAHDLVMNIADLQEIKKSARQDLTQQKDLRVELHAHTNMSTMDGVVSVKNLVSQAKAWGHIAIAITDHAGVQSFPEAHACAGDDFKIIYGVEANIVDDLVPIAYNEQHIDLFDATYVVLDVETTGLSAVYNDLIQIAATKMEKGNIVAEFDEFIDPDCEISAFITELTSITTEMVKDSKPLKQVLCEFQKFCQGAILVAHNATFDIDFLNSNYQKFNLPEISEPCIDTLEFARNLYPEFKKFGLGQLTKKFGINLESHHLANHDARATAFLNWIFIKEANSRLGVKFHDELNLKVSTSDAYKRARPFHATIYARNQIGLKNLFKLVSLSFVKYHHAKVARIPRSELTRLREGLIVGSACARGEVFTAMLEKGAQKAQDLAKFYDFIEIMPKTVYEPLIFTEVIKDEQALEDVLRQMVKLGKDLNKLVVATGNVHYLNPEEAIYREILVRTLGWESPLNRPKLKGGARPLIPKVHFRTTSEMLDEFSFLDPKQAFEIVVENSQKVASWFESLTPVKSDLYTPKMDNSEEKIVKSTYQRAVEIYGENLPEIVEKRIEKELNSIIGNGFSVIYLISQELVRRSNERGYLVGSRGSVGSSFVATMTGITEVNPLVPHYYCLNCHYSKFFTNGEYGSGFDLPDTDCPDCGKLLKKDGQDIPFETFLGFHGDKVPDIDLNFSGEDQSAAHLDARDIFGEENVFRAGTISTVADRTAFGFVKAYVCDQGLELRNAEIDRLTLGSTGVKRTTGQHPGGIIVIPQYMDVYDFTPIAYPAEDVTAQWKTTHFDFHSIHDNILKLDLLGHDDPTMIKMLLNLSGLKPDEIPIDDQKVMSIFQGSESLGVTSEQIYAKVGTLGVPEFGTRFVMGMLEETKPSTFAELLQISGLSHGTDVWLGNAQELIKTGQATLKEVIGCRDDIMLYLTHAGLDSSVAFKIMEKVRKGAWSKIPESERKTYLEAMNANNVPEWYINSCTKIKYMFPKAHAAAYVIMALRVAYFKVHMPLLYYCAYFSVRATDFDLIAMNNGLSAVKARIQEIKEKAQEATNKEKNMLSVLEICNEMLERGFTFSKIDLYKSDAKNFLIENNTLIPPFKAMESLGESIAGQIVEARDDGEFLSKEDLKQRTSLSKTLIEKMSEQGILNGLPEENQLSLFDEIL